MYARLFFSRYRFKWTTVFIYVSGSHDILSRWIGQPQFFGGFDPSFALLLNLLPFQTDPTELTNPRRSDSCCLLCLLPFIFCHRVTIPIVSTYKLVTTLSPNILMQFQSVRSLQLSFSLHHWPYHLAYPSTTPSALNMLVTCLLRSTTDLNFYLLQNQIRTTQNY